MKVLAIIDMQKDFIDGALGTKEAVAIVPKVAGAARAGAGGRRDGRLYARYASRGLSIDAGRAESAGAALSGRHGRLADRRGARR